MRTYRWADAPEEVRKLTRKRPQWVATDCGDSSALPWDRIESIGEGVVIGYDPKPRPKKKAAPTQEKAL